MPRTQLTRNIGIKTTLSAEDQTVIAGSESLIQKSKFKLNFIICKHG
jgi:hypothetical protein